jgi:hypothetical protein
VPNSTAVGLSKARELLQDFREIVRIRLDKDPPAKIPPIKAQLKSQLKPVKETQRRYAPAQRAFLSTTIKKLESLGAVCANPTSLWASPALAVPKEGSERYRFTVDLHRSNAQTEPMASSIPYLESMFQSVQGSRSLVKIDLCHTYWRLVVAVESQDIFSIQTPAGIYTLTRLIQGRTDAGNYSQGAKQPLCLEQAVLRHRLLRWLDDILVHAQTEDELLQALRAFFTVCRTYGLRVHALKNGLIFNLCNILWSRF